MRWQDRVTLTPLEVFACSRTLAIFPDADIHIKYLLKRAQTNRDRQLRFTIMNQHKGKRPDDCQQKEYRYKRFLVRNVNYTGLSFEDFVANPLAVARTLSQHGRISESSEVSYRRLKKMDPNMDSTPCQL
jgi:hypothetical protein